MHWNRTLLRDLGIAISMPTGAIASSSRDFDRFELTATSALTALARGGSVQQLQSGELHVVGGYVVEVPGASIALRDFTLRLVPSTPPRFDVVSTNGEILFYADNAMPESSGRAISISAMDLRVAPRLAMRLQRPEVAGWQIGSMRVDEGSERAVAQSERDACPTSEHWPGMPVPGQKGETYQADVLMQGVWVQVTGCRECSGPGGAGSLKLSPTTSLRNNVNSGQRAPTVAGDPRGTSEVLFAADVPWRSKFTRGCPPYGNDQHPFLIWNLYRLGSDGVLTQIGRSGVKHAHVAANASCVDDPGSNHILGRGCQDVYGPGDNDAPDTLGPRAEIIPAKGIWGRCGSIYDPKCSGKPWDFRGYDEFTHRLLVRENALQSDAAAGAHYFFEAWYFVRDDVDPYNSVASKEIRLNWNADYRLWVASEPSPAQVGPVIDRWVSPQHAGANERSTEVLTDSGRLKVAARATRLADHRYRYDYAVMNVDYVVARTRGKEPDMRVIDSRGLTGFAVSVGARSAPRSFAFDDVDSDTANDWLSKATPVEVRWQAPPAADLTWGTLYRFSFEASGEPATVRGTFPGAKDPHGKTIEFDTLGPATPAAVPSH